MLRMDNICLFAIVCLSSLMTFFVVAGERGVKMPKFLGSQVSLLMQRGIGRIGTLGCSVTGSVQARSAWLNHVVQWSN